MMLIQECYLIIKQKVLIEDHSYLSHEAPRKQSYQFDSYLMRQSVSFVTPSPYSKPSYPGAQTAMVVGMNGDEIYMDDKGRVKVQFYWDNYGKHNQNSSCWLRVAQQLAGDNWGSFFIPRVGQEVLVVGLNGDIDQPIVLASAYNAGHPAPFLDFGTTKNGYKSHCLQDSGYHLLAFDDDKDNPNILLKSQGDLWEKINKNHTSHIQQDSTTCITQGNYGLYVKQGYSQIIADEIKLVATHSQIKLNHRGICLITPRFLIKTHSRQKMELPLWPHQARASSQPS